MPSNDILRLIQGYAAFRREYFHSDNPLFKKLVTQGQSPKVLMIACSDSRVDPAIVTNCQPGDLFVVRSVANLVPPFETDNTYHGTSAALEFAVFGLNVEHIILFGHSQCGGIRALFEHEEDIIQPHGFIAKWMELAKPAKQRVIAEHTHAPLDEKLTLCGQYALVNSLKNLHSFPWVTEKVTEGKLSLHAWYFDLETGIIKTYNPALAQFEALIP